MKKVCLAVLFSLISLNAYPFWIWSPKTQEWKNPKYSPLVTPYLQYKQAERLFQDGQHQRAYKEFQKLLVNYPDSKEAAEAQYFLGLCLEKLDKPYEAFIAYQKLIDSYPNSQRINEAAGRIYDIGDFYLNRRHRTLLGISVYDFVDHPAIEIFKRLVSKLPYSEYAPQAQYKLGLIFMRLGRYEEAREAFQKTTDNYPDSEWADPAKYQLALATARAFPGVHYDSTYLQEASRRLEEFVRAHPEAQISSEAEEQLRELRDNEAKKIIDIAQFYQRRNQHESALIYYRKIVDEYYDSSYYEDAAERVKELDLMLEKGMNPRQWHSHQRAKEAKERKAQGMREREKAKQDKLEQDRLKEQLRMESSPDNRKSGEEGAEPQEGARQSRIEEQLRRINDSLANTGQSR